jgi:hypothetical protein
MSIFPEIVAAAVAMFIAFVCSRVVRSYVKRRQRTVDVRLERNGVEVDLPAATSWESLKMRLEVLSEISPRVAVLEGWTMIEASILNRASSIADNDAVRASDVIAIAQSLPGVQPATIDRLKRIRKFRNMVAHAADLSGQDDELRAVVGEIVPAMAALNPRFQNLAEAL